VFGFSLNGVLDGNGTSVHRRLAMHRLLRFLRIFREARQLGISRLDALLIARVRSME
jgi:hypothetical protein